MSTTKPQIFSIDHPIDRAAQGYEGGRAALAKELGVTVTAIGNWKKRGVPSDYCPDIERLTGIRCEELRPDVRWDVLRGQANSPSTHAFIAEGV